MLLSLIYVVFMPLTHVVVPIATFFWNIIKHTIVIPLLLMARVTLFGLVYLPLTPFLAAVKVKYDTDVPVEQTLFRLAVSIMPHLRFFLVHLLHYTMISIFVGGFVGAVAGLNLSIVARIISFPESKPQMEKTATDTNITNVVKVDKAVPHARWRMEPSTKAIIEGGPTSDLSLDPLFSRNKQIGERPQIARAASPEIKVESPQPLVSNIPVKKEPPLRAVAASPDAEVYEDDDGYSYMTYEQMSDFPPGNNASDTPAGEKENILAGDFSGAFSVHTIEEQLEHSGSDVPETETLATSLSEFSVEPRGQLAK